MSAEVRHTAPGKALFISLEGVDGSGKSTQAQLLADNLRAAGHDVVLTREPGGSPGAECIRALLVEGETNRWSPQTEILLFTAARRDHLERTIHPALAAGKIVITDRFADSTRAYQGAARAALRSTVDLLHDTMIGQEPDVTLIIDIPAAIGLGRATARGEGEARFEGMGESLQDRVRAELLRIASEAPGRCAVIDGNRAPQAVARDVLALVQSRL